MGSIIKGSASDEAELVIIEGDHGRKRTLEKQPGLVGYANEV
jgi:hypothetical protein